MTTQVQQASSLEVEHLHASAKLLADSENIALKRPNWSL